MVRSSGVFLLRFEFLLNRPLRGWDLSRISKWLPWWMCWVNDKRFLRWVDWVTALYRSSWIDVLLAILAWITDVFQMHRSCEISNFFHWARAFQVILEESRFLLSKRGCLNLFFLRWVASVWCVCTIIALDARRDYVIQLLGLRWFLTIVCVELLKVSRNFSSVYFCWLSL